MVVPAVFTPRAVCPTCRRAAAACWCHALHPVQARAAITLLQHPREARNPIGTARMAHLALPGSNLLVGVDFSADPKFSRLLQTPGVQHVVLYPSPDARDAAGLAQLDGPLMVWVIDGTWWQARKVWQRNPALHALPAYRLNPSAPGQYRIRKEPAPHCLSTVEAVGQLLDLLEPEGSGQGWLNAFHAMVEHQVAHAESPERTPRQRARPRPRAPRPFPRELAAAGERLLLVHGEGNGWPGHRDDVPQAELMQWDAVRPATGERFHALINTSTRAPNALHHLRLSEADLPAALDLPSFHAAWRDFVRDDDSWCSWGHHGMKLLARAGGEPPRFIDLQLLGNQFTSTRLGTVERAHAVMGAPDVTPSHPGRGSMRLAQMVAVVEAMRGGSGA